MASELSVIEGGPRSAPAIANYSPPDKGEWEIMRQQADVIAKSGLAPRAVSTPEKVLVIAMKGRELRVPAMQALSHIHVIEGRPTMSAELMVALVLRAGHKLRVIESSAKRCVVEGVRADDPRHASREEFTMEDARAAGVANKQVWKQYPKAMLRARATSALCRYMFPDTLMGASLTPEELGAEVNEEGEVLVQRDQDDRGDGFAETAADVFAEDEAEVVEDVGGEEVELAMRRIDDLLADWPPAQRKPDVEQVRSWAKQSAENARKAVARVQRLHRDAEDAAAMEEAADAPETDEEEEAVPDFDDMQGAAQDVPKVRAARKSQKDLIRTLAVELAGVEDGAERLEERRGISIDELTFDEANELIEELSPEDD
jgi:hypothetical protein